MKLLLILLTSLFSQANTYYAEGDYAEAATQYEQILASSTGDLTSDYAVIYYNLGNAYFKQGELAQSILAWERALRLQPSLKDAKHNLQFAQSRLVDNIEDTHSFFLSNWLKVVRDALSERTWVMMSISLFLLTLVGFFFFALFLSISSNIHCFLGLPIKTITSSYFIVLTYRINRHILTMRYLCVRSTSSITFSSSITFHSSYLYG